MIDRVKEKTSIIFSSQKGGMGRIFKYILSKLKRIKDTPYAVACGMAFGAAISCTPLIGGHVLFAVILTFIFRGSIFSSLIGTLFGNPWTLPVIWFVTYKTGNHILGKEYIVAEKINFNEILNSFLLSVQNLNIDLFMKEIYPIFFPMLIGSIPYFIITWLVFFFITKKIVFKFQEKRRLKMLEKGKLNERNY